MSETTLNIDEHESIETSAANAGKVKVWDPLVRAFHWLTLVAVVVAFISEDWREVHEFAGYFVMGALAVRIVWGLIGTKHARFSDFVPSPRGLLDYLKGTLHGQETRYLGHNPAGGAMVVALMATLVAVCVTGWMMGLDAFWGAEWVEEVHEGTTNVLLGLIGLHVAGVLWSSYRTRENLVRSMVTGVKDGVETTKGQ